MSLCSGISFTFHLFFPQTSYVEHHFMCLRAICVSSFVSVQVFCPFFHWVVCNWLVRVLNIFSIQILCLIFSPCLRLAFFIFLMVSSEATKKINFDEVPINKKQNWPQASGLQNWERTRFCWVKPPSLWQFLQQSQETNTSVNGGLGPTFV